MPPYFFDVMDDVEAGLPDGIGKEFSDRNSIPDEAVALIANIARDRLPGGAHRAFGVSVHENEGRAVSKRLCPFKLGAMIVAYPTQER